jgi:hypothetical protein
MLMSPRAERRWMQITGLYDQQDCLRPLERWDRGFESHLRHGCLCLFCVRTGSGLAMGWFPVQGALPTVLGLRNWRETKRFTDALCSKVGATGKRERGGRGTLLRSNIWQFYVSLFCSAVEMHTFQYSHVLDSCDVLARGVWISFCLR